MNDPVLEQVYFIINSLWFPGSTGNPKLISGDIYRQKHWKISIQPIREISFPACSFQAWVENKRVNFRLRYIWEIFWPIFALDLQVIVRNIVFQFDSSKFSDNQLSHKSSIWKIWNCGPSKIPARAILFNLFSAILPKCIF